MNALIIEDEEIAMRALTDAIHASDYDIGVIGKAKTITESVAWLTANPMPDIIFMDINLGDGSSFSIFERVQITCPVIFVTAYDEFALKAFEVNCIDYLLKPITPRQINRAMKKLDSIGNLTRSENIDRLLEWIGTQNHAYRRSFLVAYKDKLLPVATSDVAFFYATDKQTHITTYDGRTYTSESSLDNIGRSLPPDEFFRANRQYIIAHRAIKEITVWFAGKLSVSLYIDTPEHIIVSRAKASQFKSWYTK